MIADALYAAIEWVIDVLEVVGEWLRPVGVALGHALWIGMALGLGLIAFMVGAAFGVTVGSWLGEETAGYVVGGTLGILLMAVGICWPVLKQDHEQKKRAASCEAALDAVKSSSPKEKNEQHSTVGSYHRLAGKRKSREGYDRNSYKRHSHHQGD